MPVELIAKITPKNDGFVGLVDADQVIGGGASGTLPDAALSESNLTQFGIFASIRYVGLLRNGTLTEYPDPDDAFTAANLSGDVIVVPPGTFYCSSAAYLTAENQSIVGLAGPDDCVLEFSADVGTVALYLYNATSGSNIRVNYTANSSSVRYGILAGNGTVLKNVKSYTENVAHGVTTAISAQECTLFNCWGDATVGGAGSSYGLNFNDSTAYFSHGRARGGAGDNQGIRFDTDNDSWLYFCTGVAEGTAGTETGLTLWNGTGYAFMCRFDGGDYDISVSAGKTMYVSDCKYDVDNSRVIGDGELIAMGGDRLAKSAVKSIADGCIVSDAGGTDVDWTAGHIFYNNQTHSVNSAAGQALTDNAINYIYFDHGVDVNVLQISTTRPIDDDQVWVACAACQDGDIVGLCNVDPLEDMVPDISLALGLMFPTFVISGGVVSAYTADATSDLDVIMTAMVYIAGAHEVRSATAINSEDDAMKMHFHDAADAWTTSTSNTVDTANYDDPTDGQALIAIPASKWVRGMFYYSQELLNYIYPTTYYTTEAQALAAENPATPPGLERCIPLAAIVFQQGETDIDNATFIDIRPGNTHIGATPTSDHGNLAGLADDDHTQYLLVDGTRAMSGNLDMGANEVTNVGNVDGVDVSDHSARHDVGGTDALTTTDGQVASEILATDANKGIRPVRLGVNTAVPGSDGDAHIGNDLDVDGDADFAGDIVMSGASKALKGTGSNVPTIGSTTAAEKIGHAYQGAGYDLYPDDESNAYAGLWRRFVNVYGLTNYDHHRGSGTGAPSGTSVNATPSNLWAAWYAGYYGWFNGTYYAQYPNHASLPAGLIVHSADPIATGKRLTARIVSSGTSEFGLWADNFDADYPYVVGSRIYRFDAYTYGNGAETLVYTRIAYAVCTVLGVGAAATFGAWTNVAVSGPYGPFGPCGDGLTLSIIVNYTGTTSRCYAYIFGENGSGSGFGNALLYNDNGVTLYGARRMGMYHRLQGFAWAGWDWFYVS